MAVHAVHAARKARRLKSFGTIAKVGLESSISENAMKKITESAFERRQILRVPSAIQRANPDKHFVFVNMQRMEKNGYWHERGYELFKAMDLPGEMVQKFGKSPDGFIHRNEMALAWIPKEEHEARELERLVLRNERNIADVITKRPELASFAPHAKVTTEIKKFAKATTKEE